MVSLGRGVSSVGTACAWCTVGAVDCIGCNADTFEGWPPGLFASTTGEQINGIAQDRQSGPLFSMLQMPNDGSPCRASDAFSRGVVQFSEDRRNLERFRATAGRWQCRALRGLAARAVCLNGRGTDQRDNGKRRPGTCWCVLNEWNNFRALVGVLVREISNLSNK